METAPQRSSPEQALASVAGALRCPHCAGGLTVAGRSLACPAGHRYDIARPGYVSLPGPRRSPHAGDSAEMAAARDAFLDAGHYAPIAAALAEAADQRPRGLVVDLGAGTGYYLARLLEALPGCDGLALDASRPALRRAVRRHPRIAAVACDVWQPLPLRDGAADLAICVFAPRNAPELARILAPGGGLVVVAPTAAHLAELGSIPGMLRVPEDKAAHVRRSLGPGLVPVGSRTLEFPLRLRRAEVVGLVAMGPSSRHLARTDLGRRLSDDVALTVSVTVQRFERAAAGRSSAEPASGN